MDPADVATLGEFDDSEFEVLLYEFKADLNAYLAALPASARHRTLEDLIRFNEENRVREMPYFAQEIFEKAQAKGPLTEKKYRDALSKDGRLSRKEGIDKTMDRHKLDALIAPTSGPATLIDLVNGDYGVGGSSSPPAVAGYPDLTLAVRLVPGNAGGDVHLREGVERGDADPDRLRVRAGHEVAKRQVLRRRLA